MAGKLSVGEEAERLSRRRTRVLWASAVLFLLWQTSFAVWGVADSAPLRSVDAVKISAWALWAAVLLLMLATGGGLLRRAEVRRRMNDEASVANRHAAQRVGFWVGAATLIGLYVATFFTEVSVHDLLHLTLTLMVGTALLSYAFLERRAERER